MHQLRYYNFKRKILRFHNSRIVSMIPGFMKQFQNSYVIYFVAENFHFHDDMIYYSQNEIIKE